MNENLEKRSNEYATLCGWCGIPLGSANLVRQSVCIRCYKLLRGANISDEEVFSSKDVKKKGSLSRQNNETTE
jgi:hypothetical protein